jgi:hypothetical protein
LGEIPACALDLPSQADPERDLANAPVKAKAYAVETRSGAISRFLSGYVGQQIGRDRAGVIVVPAEVDYVSWTNRTSYFANRPDLVSPKRATWLSGQMAPLAKKNFQALGWNVRERAKL